MHDGVVNVSWKLYGRTPHTFPEAGNCQCLSAGSEPEKTLGGGGMSSTAWVLHKGKETMKVTVTTRSPMFDCHGLSRRGCANRTHRLDDQDIEAEM